MVVRVAKPYYDSAYNMYSLCKFVLREVRYVNYCVAVGLFVGLGCERSELPCLTDGIIKLGRRPWSFYIYGICCLIDRRI